MPDAIFPPEIEYIIFTNVLSLSYSSDDNDHESTLNLLLVAKRVHTWLIPKLMQTIVIEDGSIERIHPKKVTISTSTFQKYGHHVQNLFLCTNDFRDHLSSCPNTTKLLLWTSRVFDHMGLAQLAQLRRLTHLSIDLDHIPQHEIESLPDLLALFSRITHLETLSTVGSPRHQAHMTYFTSLTHLALMSGPSLNVRSTLSEHPKLQVLVTQDTGDRLGVLANSNELEGEEDERVVMMSFGSEQEEWLLDVDEGRGMWAIADRAVCERRAKRQDVLKL